jgi:hypothetical protein
VPRPYSHANGGSDNNCDFNRNGDGHCDINRDIYTHGHSHSDGYTNCNGNGDCNRNCDGHCNAHSDANLDPNGHSYGDSKSTPDATTSSHAPTSPDSPAPIADTEFALQRINHGMSIFGAVATGLWPVVSGDAAYFEHG